MLPVIVGELNQVKGRVILTSMMSAGKIRTNIILKWRVKMGEDKYEFGKCKNCNTEAPLKNGYCSNCQDRKMDLPEGFEEMFRGLGGE